MVNREIKKKIQKEIIDYLNLKYPKFILNKELIYSNKVSNEGTISVVITNPDSDLVCGSNFYLEIFLREGNKYIENFVDKMIKEIKKA